MPDTLNKQAIVNLLIDSPLREPIKINLIDIVNNTTEPDLPKIFPTIVKELEIFQKATERRMKLAEESIAKLGSPAAPAMATLPTAPAAGDDLSATPQSGLSVPPLDLPPLPTAPAPLPPEPPATDLESNMPPSSALPAPEPLGGTTPPVQGDEAALAEIQKELDSLKTETATDIASAASPAPAVPPTPQQ